MVFIVGADDACDEGRPPDEVERHGSGTEPTTARRGASGGRSAIRWSRGDAPGERSLWGALGLAGTTPLGVVHPGVTFRGGGLGGGAGGGEARRYCPTA